MSNSVGRWFNETPLPTPGNMIFNDEEAPNELIDDGTDFRNEYYQEDVFPLSNVGKPHKDEEGEWDLGVLEGTIANDLMDLKDVVSNLRDGDVLAILKNVETVETIVGLRGATPSDLAGLYYGQLLGWMIEHVEPIRKSADGIFGNPDMVKAYAQSWVNIRDRLAEVAIDWVSKVATGTGDWRGESGDAYRQRAIQLITRIAVLGYVADGLEATTSQMEKIVEISRDEMLAILVDVYTAGIEAAVKLAMTLGTGAGKIIFDYLKEVAKAVVKMGIAFHRMWEALQELKDLAAPLGTALAQLSAEPVRTN